MDQNSSILFWAWSIPDGKTPHEQIKISCEQFNRRFRRAARRVHVHPSMMTGAGLLCPVGVDLVPGEAVPPGYFYFEVAK
jgi:hypothetical protein